MGSKPRTDSYITLHAVPTDPPGQQKDKCKRFGDLVAELLDLKADVIVTSVTPGARAIPPTPRAHGCEVCRLDGRIAQNDT